MKRLGLATAALVLALCSGCRRPRRTARSRRAEHASSDAPPIQRAPAARTAPRYFIDFRAHSALSYGHTFVVFGRAARVDAAKCRRAASQGRQLVHIIFGHLLPVDPKPARATAISTSNTRRHATASGSPPGVPRRWSAISASCKPVHRRGTRPFNCNAFVGTIAHFVGLSSPPTWLFPDDFVNSLRRMNEGHQRYAVAPSARKSERSRVRSSSGARSRGVEVGSCPS